LSTVETTRHPPRCQIARSPLLKPAFPILGVSDGQMEWLECSGSEHSPPLPRPDQRGELISVPTNRLAFRTRHSPHRCSDRISPAWRECDFSSVFVLDSGPFLFAAGRAGPLFLQDGSRPSEECPSVAGDSAHDSRVRQSCSPTRASSLPFERERETAPCPLLQSHLRSNTSSRSFLWPQASRVSTPREAP
jgi:hypothetical protein